MTKLLPYSCHPSTPLRMTIFAALNNQLLGQPLLVRSVLNKSAHEGRTPTTDTEVIYFVNYSG
jgi:hypothetical protein